MNLLFLMLCVQIYTIFFSFSDSETQLMESEQVETKVVCRTIYALL